MVAEPLDADVVVLAALVEFFQVAEGVHLPGHVGQADAAVFGAGGVHAQRHQGQFVGHSGVGGQEGHSAGTGGHHGESQDVGVESDAAVDVPNLDDQVAELFGGVSHNGASSVVSCRHYSASG